MLVRSTLNRKLISNETLIKNEFNNAYIDAKYYNQVGGKDVKLSSKIKIEQSLAEKAIQLVRDYRGKDRKFSGKVENIMNVFTIICRAEIIVTSNLTIAESNQLLRSELIPYGTLMNWDANRLEEIIKQIRQFCNVYDVYVFLS